MNDSIKLHLTKSLQITYVIDCTRTRYKLLLFRIIQLAPSSKLWSSSRQVSWHCVPISSPSLFAVSTMCRAPVYALNKLSPNRMHPRRMFSIVISTTSSALRQCNPLRIRRINIATYYKWVRDKDASAFVELHH